MPRPDDYLKTLKRALEDFTGDQAELWLEDKTSDVTKFNEGGIFQNISEKGLTVRARVLKNGKIGTASVQGETAEAARRALEQAGEMASFGQKAPADYAFPMSEAPLDLPSFDETTANYSPAQRARDLKHAVAKAAKPGMDFSGSLKLDLTGLYVVNTSGLANQARTSQADINYISLLNDTQSHAGAAAAGVNDLDLEGLAREAASTCVQAQNPTDCEPGEYTMVLPPNALADLTPFFGMLLFSGLADLEGRCCLSGRMGQEVASELVNLSDDPTDPGGICRPLDNEGVAKRPFKLMEKGVPLGFVHDSLSSAQAGLKTTGHAFPGTPAVYGPSTANLVMQPGDTSLEEIIKGVEKGILATRLHYVRCLNDKEALVGGVTSNGTFLIKDGRIVHPVKPMRFTTRLVDGMLKNISAVTGERLTMIRTAQGPTSVSLYSSAHTLPGVRSDAWQLRKTD